MSTQRMISKWNVSAEQSTEVPLPIGIEIVLVQKEGINLTVYALTDYPSKFEKRWFHIVPINREVTIGGSAKCVGCFWWEGEMRFLMLDAAPGQMKVSSQTHAAGCAGGMTVGALIEHLKRMDVSTRVLIRVDDPHDEMQDIEIIRYEFAKIAGTGNGKYIPATNSRNRNTEFPCVVITAI